MHSIKLLRQYMAQQSYAGCVIPKVDPYRNEYVPAGLDRLKWISGFTGSAGVAIILHDKAALFVDGRYTLQAEAETAGTGLEIYTIPDVKMTEWLKTALKPGDQLVYDPWLLNKRECAQYTAACEAVGANFTFLHDNPVDAVWKGRPLLPLSTAMLHDVVYTGQSWEEKLANVCNELAKQDIDATVITDPASICWLLNIRAEDVPYTPLLLAHAVIHKSGRIAVYCDVRKISARVSASFDERVQWYGTPQLPHHLKQMAAYSVLLDHDAPVALYEILPRAVDGLDPCALPRACKNKTEIDGIRAAHDRDGVALTKFLSWLQKDGIKQKITEYDIGEKLKIYRAKQDLFQGESFPTIAGVGSNGAVVHYRADKETALPIDAGELLLIDSGGQYFDGTTDVTRTVWLGKSKPPAEIINRYTLVLKGHIALAIARFPVGTTGRQLDTLARQYLWAAGLDFSHGTGHGVGHYLGVHEGPQGISPKARDIPLQPGMILSNEPGYYKVGAYGIRLENLVLVRDDLEQPKGAEKKLLGFETLTKVKFEDKLIDKALLSVEEQQWLDGYMV